MVTVELPAALRGLAGNEARVQVSAATVGAALDALCARSPALRSKLFTDTGALRRTVGVFVDDDDVRDTPAHPLRDGQVVVLIAAMAGG